MTDAVNLGAARAEKHNDCRKWTVVEALRSALDDVESGRIDARMVYVAFQSTRPLGVGYPSVIAGATNLEVQGLLAQHLHYASAR